MAAERSAGNGRLQAARASRPVVMVMASTSASRQRVWLTTSEICELFGISRETLRRMRLRGVLQPGKHFRRWGCTQGKGPLQWHAENIEATITGWSRRNL